MKQIEFKFWRWRVELTIESFAEIQAALDRVNRGIEEDRERKYIVVHSREELMKFMPDRYWYSIDHDGTRVAVWLRHNDYNSDDDDPRDCLYFEDGSKYDDFLEWLQLKGYTDGGPIAGTEDTPYPLSNYFHPERRDYWEKEKRVWLTPRQHSLKNSFDNILERIADTPWDLTTPSYHEPLLDDDFDDDEVSNLS